MPKFVFSRASIIDEVFTVEAPDEDTALDMVQEGHPKVKMEQGGWIDWYHEEYHLEEVTDDLVEFLNSKDTECATS